MKPIATVLLAIGLFLPCIAGCSRSYLFEGVVVDGQGVGIIGADVIVYPYDQERSRSGNGVKTGANGKFEVGWGSIPGVKFFKMEVSKAGFDVDKRLVLEDEQGIRIVLSVAGSKVEQPVSYSFAGSGYPLQFFRMLRPIFPSIKSY